MTGRSQIKGLGEVAFRVNNLAQMKGFYQEVLRLEVPGESLAGVLLKIAEGYGGHTQASTIDLSDYESEKKHLEGLGLGVGGLHRS